MIAVDAILKLGYNVEVTGKGSSLLTNYYATAVIKAIPNEAPRRLRPPDTIDSGVHVGPTTPIPRHGATGRSRSRCCECRPRQIAVAGRIGDG